MPSLIKSLLTCYSHCYSKLPYNLNWADFDWCPFAQFLRSHPINVIDVGARGGIAPELEKMKPFLAYYGFDSDEQEAERLSSLSDHGCTKYHISPYFIGKTIGEVDFKIYNRLGESSVYLPSSFYQEKFGGPDFTVKQRVSVRSTTLDALLIAGLIPAPDLLKLDTQGNEFDILAASPKTLDATSMIETEVEFLPFYDGQKLFHDISKFLYEKGFQLLYLNRVFQSRLKYNGQNRGQITFGDALFGRNEEMLAGFSAERMAKYALLLRNYGHFDLSAAIVASNPDVADLVPGIEKSFHGWDGKLNGVKRGLIMQLDKFIMLLLHYCRTNQLRGDSDRSWPIR